MRNLLAIFFLLATLAGLLLGLNLAFIYPWESDSANAGLFPMEVMRGNFEFVFAANNPYFFTDFIFHLVVQPLTGYSPTALVLTSYAMYVLIVLACAALALRLAGRMEALAAAALVANLPFMGLRYVLYPLYHNGTTLFILLSILVFYADRPPFKLGFRTRVLIIALLQFLGVFSDTLMLPVFTLPLIVYSAYRLLKQRQGTDAENKNTGTEGSPVLWLASTVPAIIIYLLKTRIGQLWPGGPILTLTGADLGSPGSLLKHPEMFNEYTGALISNAGGLFLAIIILVIIIFVILERKDRFLQAVLILSGIFMLIGFMSMTIGGDPARYLTPISIISLVVIATGTMCRSANYIPLIAAAVIVLICIVSNLQLTNESHQDLVGAQQEFVTYLESINVTHAYSHYWSANIYTYLSNGKIMVEPVEVVNDTLAFHSINSAPRWANIWPDGNDTEPVIITVTGDPLYDWTQRLNEKHPPARTYQVANGWIYFYNGSLVE